MSAVILAFDKQTFTKANTARHFDEQGFLHVEGCNISKATVNPYLGAEIPTWEQLGLDPRKTYHMLRPAEELAKAATTCNMIPLMDAHIEVSAFDLEDPDIAKHQVGNTGQMGRFEAPYLINDLVIHKAGAIEGVTSKEVCELSCAYRYDVVMTPGEFEGVKYDGYMTNLRFNHVALVEEGRAGPDVMVRDSAEALKEARVQRIDLIKQAAAKSPWARIRAIMDGSIAKREDVNPKEGAKKYGNVTFADPKNKRYPIDTEAHVRAAASYFGMAKNRSKYSKEEQSAIQGRIDAAERKFKIGAAKTPATKSK